MSKNSNGSRTEPIRPPLHKARKQRCACGRWPVFSSRAPRSDGKVRTDRSHSLCIGCFRRLMDHFWGAQQSNQQNAPEATRRRRKHLPARVALAALRSEDLAA